MRRGPELAAMDVPPLGAETTIKRNLASKVTLEIHFLSCGEVRAFAQLQAIPLTSDL
jgi:hypothetical protein